MLEVKKMSQAKITLIGLENYLNPEHSVFEQLYLPEGIDKDILVKGNKVYSPNTCCLVPKNVNNLFIKKHISLHR